RGPDRSGHLPLVEDGAGRHQRVHRRRPRRLRLDAGRGARRHAAGRAREPGAPLPARVDQALRAFPDNDHDPDRASRRRARTRRAAKGLMRHAARATGASVVVGWPWAAPPYFVFLASLIAINAIVAIGLNLLSGYTNQLSFGHAGFLAIGAYAAAILTIRAPALPVPAALLLAGLVTAAVGLALGVPCLRLEGLYLAMATLAFGFVVVEAIMNLDWLTRGNDGLRVPAARLGPWALQSDTARYYLVVAVGVVMVWAALNLARTRTGRALLAIRESEIAAQAS